MRFFYLLLISLLLFVGYLLKDNLPTTLLTEHPSGLKPSSDQQHTKSPAVNTWLKGVDSLQTTDTGNPRLTLHAERLQQKSDNTVVLIKPVIVVYNVAGKPSWHIQAKHGRTDTHTHALQLTEQVQLIQLEEGVVKPGQRVLKTSQLLIFIKRRYATTDKPVVISEGGSQLHATGLRADLAHDKILLLSNVDGKTQVQHHGNTHS